MANSTPGRLLPVLAALVVGAVVADAARRLVARPGTRFPAPAPAAAATDTARSAAAGRVAPSVAQEAAEAEVRRRALARERIGIESAGTYVTAMLRETDSMIRRWPDAALRRPLRLAVVRASTVPNFREEFVANVAWAVGRWNGSLIPVRIQSGADTLIADIVLTWVDHLDSNRTGRADLTWDNHGHILHAAVFLATHTPEGREIDPRQMTALALHELGHSLGLGHSPRRDDALYPVTRAIELTERDRRTARLLYALPPGSLK